MTFISLVNGLLRFSAQGPDKSVTIVCVHHAIKHDLNVTQVIARHLPDLLADLNKVSFISSLAIAILEVRRCRNLPQPNPPLPSPADHSFITSCCFRGSIQPVFRDKQYTMRSNSEGQNI